MFKKFLMGLFAGTMATSSPAAESWSVATAQDNGKPLIIRYLSKLPDNFDKQAYPLLMAITWPYQSDSGMPSQSEKNRMNELEDALTEAVERNNAGLLTVLVTGNGVFEMQFYTRTQDEFLYLLNMALAGRPAFPIQIVPQPDPEWSAYQRFAGEN